MKKTVLFSTLALLMALSFISCGNVGHIPDDEAMAVIGMAGQNAFISNNNVLGNDETLSRAINLELPITLNTVITYEGKDYDLSGSYNLTLMADASATGASFSYKMDGTIEITTPEGTSSYDIDLTYSTTLTTTSDSVSWSMTTSGTFGGRSITNKELTFSISS